MSLTSSQAELAGSDRIAFPRLPAFVSNRAKLNGAKLIFAGAQGSALLGGRPANTVSLFAKSNCHRYQPRPHAEVE